MTRVYFITGTSSGFGRALAEEALKQGNKVVMTARKPETVATLVEQYPENAFAQRLDVTDPAERERTVNAATERFGRIDVLANIAGQGSLGALEEFSSEQARRQLEVNFVSVLELTRLVLPVMRRQRTGHILNLTSIGGLAAVGGFALYGAAKFAVEGFSEALRDEVKPLGIKVTIVEPGAFRTEFAGEANMRPAEEIQDYRPVIEPIREYLYGGAGTQPGDPRKAALAMTQVVESENPPLRLMLGADAFGLWKKKRDEMEAELEAWREVGENTAFDGVQVREIGS